MIDENVSEYLVAQSFEVIFKEIGRYIKVIKNFAGLDWVKYARLRTKELKDGGSSSIADLQDLIVKDLEEVADKGEESKVIIDLKAHIEESEDQALHEQRAKDFIEETKHAF